MDSILELFIFSCYVIINSFRLLNYFFILCMFKDVIFLYLFIRIKCLLFVRFCVRYWRCDREYGFWLYEVINLVKKINK